MATFTKKLKVVPRCKGFPHISKTIRIKRAVDDPARDVKDEMAIQSNFQ